jgi:ferredoxin--NADP+ reductase
MNAAILAGGPRGERALRDPPTENATIVEREDVSATVARIVVRPDGPLAPFLAGQYVAIGVRVGDRLVQRPYSTAAHPRTADAHELLVRLVPGGTLTPHLWALPVGARVTMGRPRGLFVLEADDSRQHLLVASGTGLAPFIAMVRDLLDRPVPPPVVVVHGASRAEDLAYRGLLSDLDAAGRLVYVPTVSRPLDPGSAGWSGRVGRTEVAVAEVCVGLDPAATVAYLCGNPGMVAGACELLAARGFTDVRSESFWEAPAAAA